MTCKAKTHGIDVRNTLILPLRKEDEKLSLGQILSNDNTSACTKICEPCNQNRNHKLHEELLIHPPVLIINLQRFKENVEENFVGFQNRRKPFSRKHS